MITGELKSKVDRIWDAFWSGGIANPLEVVEQSPTCSSFGGSTTSGRTQYQADRNGRWQGKAELARRRVR
jgi:hypothetical protein